MEIWTESFQLRKSNQARVEKVLSF